MKPHTVGLYLLLCLLIAACGRQTEEERATAEAVRTLTELYGDEARTAIETLQMVSGSLEADRDRSILSEVLTGPYLEDRLSSGMYDEVFVTQSMDLQEVRVLEYSPTQFKAVGCGILNIDEMTIEGEYIRTLPRRDFRGVYAFVREDEKWKLAASYSFMDVDGALRDWPSVWDWQKEYLGDVPSIIHEHSNCGMDH
jgi:hypothetical protein